MTCYRNKDPNKNIGKSSGKKFSVFFEGKASFLLYEDGTTLLMKEDSGNDLELFEAGVEFGILEKFVV